jgi:hypothetical protein
LTAPFLGARECVDAIDGGGWKAFADCRDGDHAAQGDARRIVAGRDA